MTTRSRKDATKSEEAPPTSSEASPEDVLDVEAPAAETSEPEAAAPSDEPVKEARSERADGGVTLVYRGNADVFSHGAFRIRPGQPVTVPSDVAEELLTFPRERFEKVESQE